MPKAWYDRPYIRQTEDMTEAEKELALRLVADKKPYFMRYIYPMMMREYNTYIANTGKKCLRLFGISIKELFSLPYGELTPEQQEFIEMYHAHMPVGTSDCVMNQICRRFEEEFDGYVGKYKSSVPFDYSILKSGIPYTETQYNAVREVYRDYLKCVDEFMAYTRSERIDNDEYVSRRSVLLSEFEANVFAACQNRQQLCDILVDVCYAKETSKQFLWDIMGDQLIENLLNKNGRVIQYPAKDRAGDIVFHGERFTFKYKVMEGTEDGSVE